MSKLGLVRLAGLFVLSFLVAACAGGGEEQSDTTSTSAVPLAAGERVAECVSLGYPCSLAETPEALVERTRTLMALARERYLDSGSMTDALKFLEGEADVVEAIGDDTALTFRVEGAPPAWLMAREPDRNSKSPAAMPVAFNGTVPGSVFPGVVGEDTTNDGVVDNRDQKRALVLAPYMWDFAPNDESELVAAHLESLPGYEGNVDFHANKNRGDRNLALDHFLSFNDYDVIFIGSHGSRLCLPAENGGEICRSVVYTGVYLDFALEAPFSGISYGMILIDWVDSQRRDTDMTPRFSQLGMSYDFFAINYPNGLDNTLMVLSACETGRIEGEEFATWAGGDDFVMMAWDEVVFVDDAWAASVFLLEQLSYGITTTKAYGALIQAGLAFADNEDGPTTFELFRPNDGDVRLIELPTLMDEGSPMTDGSPIPHRVVPGVDGQQSLRLDLQVKGVDDPSRFKVRYEIDGMPTSDTVYDLAGGSHDPGLWQYDVTHEVEIDFDLPTDLFELRVVVDLPEGGESTYTVLVRSPYQSCNQVIADDMAGIWDAFRPGAAVPKRTHALDRGPSLTFLSQCSLANETGNLTIMTFPGGYMEGNYAELTAPGGMFGHDGADGIKNFPERAPAPSLGRDAVVFFGGTLVVQENVEFWWLVFQVGGQEWWVRGGAPGLVAGDVISVGEWLIERMGEPGDRNPGDDPPDSDGPPGDS